MRLFVLMLISFGFLLSGCQESLPGYPSRQPPGNFDSTSNIAAGRQLFLRHCASCHGDTGEGRSPRANFFAPPAPDFKPRHYAEIDPAYLYWRIAKGKSVEPFLSRGSVMPRWEAYFSPDQIWSLVAYLQSRSR